MLRRNLRFMLVALAFLLVAHPARSQNAYGSPPQPIPAATPAQAQQALDILQDDRKRAQLIQTLQTIAKASPPAASTPAAPSPVPADNLGVQLLVQVSDWFGDVSGQLAVAARNLSDFPMIWRWLVQLATDPIARQTLLDTAWRLALVIVCAFLAERIIRRAIRRPLAAVDRYVPRRARQPVDLQPPPSSEAASIADAHELRRWHFTLAYAWQLVLRLPFVLTRLFLELLPVLCFAAIGNLLLATHLGREATARVVILALVNAYVLYSTILYVSAAVVSPTSSQPSLLIIRDETAAYFDVWWTRIAAVTVFGVAIANIALLLGLYQPAYVAVVRLLMLVVHLFVVIIILQCRRSIADAIRAPEGETGPFAMMRNRLADIWHILAIILNLALWAVWALQVQNGYALLLRYFFAGVAVLAIARLASLAS